MSQDKKKLRKEFLRVRNSLGPKIIASKSRRICESFYSNIFLKKNSKVAFFSKGLAEPDLSLLMEMYLEDGHIICLPCVDELNEPMSFRKYLHSAPLEKNEYLNFLQPPEHFETIFPDIIITPLVAFDAAGNRLGQGGGYYDRTFEYLSGFTEFISVGVAFAEQQAPYIPANTNDYRLDSIVTDKRVLVFS